MLKLGGLELGTILGDVSDIFLMPSSIKSLTSEGKSGCPVLESSWRFSAWHSSLTVAMSLALLSCVFPRVPLSFGFWLSALPAGCLGGSGIDFEIELGLAPIEEDEVSVNDAVGGLYGSSNALNLL